MSGIMDMLVDSRAGTRSRANRWCIGSEKTGKREERGRSYILQATTEMKLNHPMSLRGPALRMHFNPGMPKV